VTDETQESGDTQKRGRVAGKGREKCPDRKKFGPRRKGKQERGRINIDSYGWTFIREKPKKGRSIQRGEKGAKNGKEKS